MSNTKFQFLGFSTFLITTTKGTKILIDPYLNNNDSSPLKAKDLPPIDLIIVSHGAFDHMEDTAPSPERTIQARRDLGMFEEALQLLPEQTRALVVMVYVDGLSQNEAAQMLSISKGYASKLLKRGLEELRKHEWEIS